MKQVVGLLFAVGLFAALVPETSFSFLIRPVLGAAGLLGLLLPAAGVATDRTASWWAVVLLSLLALSIVAVPFAADERLALQDVARLTFMVFVTLGITRGLGQPEARRAFVGGLAFIAVVAAMIIIAVFLSYGGTVLDTFTGDAAPLKAFAASEYGILLNSITYACVLGLLAGVLPRPGWMRLLLAPVAIAAVALGGSRTSLLSLAVAVLAGLLLLAIHHQPRRIPAWVSYLTLAVAMVAMVTWVGGRVDRPQLDPGLLSEATTGRFDLWTAAVDMFAARPLTGWGPGSFSELVLPQLSATLAGSGAQTIELAGAAHSAYLTVLAERGVLGIVGSLAILIFLTATALRLFHGRGALTGIDRGISLVAPFAVVSMMVRGTAEQSGLLGAADSLIDFMEFGVAALIIATAAALPDSQDADGLAHP